MFGVWAVTAPQQQLSTDAERLLHLLTYSRREVYWSPRTDTWHVTRGGWPNVPLSAIRELYHLGLIWPVYSNSPHDAYHTGRTLDIDATIEERKRGNKRLIYKPEGWRPSNRSRGDGCSGFEL